MGFQTNPWGIELLVCKNLLFFGLRKQAVIIISEEGIHRATVAEKRKGDTWSASQDYAWLNHYSLGIPSLQIQARMTPPS